MSLVTQSFGESTVTVVLQLPGQPSRVMLSTSVNLHVVVVGPATTITELPLVEPTIAPQPLIVQLCVTTPPPGLTVEVYVFVVPVLTGLGPAMLQVGFGLTVIVC